MEAADYLRLPYRRVLILDSESGGYTALVQEFPGCIAEGGTAEKALENLDSAMLGWVEAMTDSGRDVPTPLEENRYSGRTPLRMPRSLHRKAAEAAEQEGVSLNHFIVAAVAEAVGIKSKDKAMTAISSTGAHFPDLMASVTRLAESWTPLAVADEHSAIFYVESPLSHASTVATMQHRQRGHVPSGKGAN